MKQYEKEIAERYDRVEEMKAQGWCERMAFGKPAGALEGQRLEGSKHGLEELSEQQIERLLCSKKGIQGQNRGERHRSDPGLFNSRHCSALLPTCRR